MRDILYFRAKKTLFFYGFEKRRLMPADYNKLKLLVAQRRAFAIRDFILPRSRLRGAL